MVRTKILNGVEVALSKEEEKEVEAQIVRDKERAEEYAKVKYRDDRRLAYPEIGDQLDDLLNKGYFQMK